MRNTDTTSKNEGLRPSCSPAAHQRAGRIMEFDSADLAIIAAALERNKAQWINAAENCERNEAHDEAAVCRRHAAHCERLLRRI